MGQIEEIHSQGPKIRRTFGIQLAEIRGEIEKN